MDIATELKDLEAARSVVYRGMADLYRLPSHSLEAVINAVVSALTRLGSVAMAEAEHLKESYASMTDKRLLEVEYTRLFLGPFAAPAPPYGSIYLEKNRSLMGNSTIDARRHYLSAGLDLSQEFKEAPDHIVAEFEFMHALIAQEVQAIDALDVQLLTENIRHQHTFLTQHLGAWIPLFAANTLENTASDYYRHMAMLTQDFVAEDMATVPEQAELLQSSAV